MIANGQCNNILTRPILYEKGIKVYTLTLFKFSELLEKNLYPGNFIDQQIKQYLHAQFSDTKHKEPSNSTYVSYYKLPSLEICWQKLSNIVNIVAKVLISKLPFRHLKLEICLVLMNQGLSI